MVKYRIIKSCELYHHGILGQKWGVRRYQNPDGSLTPAGRERYLHLSVALDMTGTKEQIKAKKALKNDPNFKSYIKKQNRYHELSDELEKLYLKESDKGKTEDEIIFSKEFQNKYSELNKISKEIYNQNKGESTIFVSGSSKTQDKNSPFYLKKLPKDIKKDLKKYMKNNDTIIVGDAPGFDRQVQDFIKKYKNVEIYSPGNETRYMANKKWKNHLIDAPEYEKGSSQWLAKKDIAMTNRATEGLALTINGGSQATRNNVQRLVDQYKNVKVYELFESGDLMKRTHF